MVCNPSKCNGSGGELESWMQWTKKGSTTNRHEAVPNVSPSETDGRRWMKPSDSATRLWMRDPSLWDADVEIEAARARVPLAPSALDPPRPATASANMQARELEVQDHIEAAAGRRGGGPGEAALMARHAERHSALDLSHSPAGPQRMASLAHSLATFPHLRSVRLNRTSLTDEFVGSLARAIAASEARIDELELSGNRIGFMGIEALQTHVLTFPCPLTKLVLENNPLGDKGAHRLMDGLANATLLAHLDVSNCKIGDTGFHALAELVGANSSICTLLAGWNRAGGGLGIRALAQALSVNARIEQLSLAWNGLKDEGGIQIGGMLGENTTLIDVV